MVSNRSSDMRVFTLNSARKEMEHCTIVIRTSAQEMGLPECGEWLRDVVEAEGI